MSLQKKAGLAAVGAFGFLEPLPSFCRQLEELSPLWQALSSLTKLQPAAAAQEAAVAAAAAAAGEEGAAAGEEGLLRSRLSALAEAQLRRCASSCRLRQGTQATLS